MTPGHPAYLPARADDTQRQDAAYQHWVAGEWDPATFLVVEPGHTVVPSYDDEVLRADPLLKATD